MGLLDAPWIGKLVSIAVLTAVVGFLWLCYWLEKKGVFKNYSRGLGRGLLEVEAMLRPSRQHVRQAKESKQQVEEDQGGSGPR